tara:strand:+ start:810 stop:956 length:147 start_codon:yes stop_codon:yes gene_type:complete
MTASDQTDFLRNVVLFPHKISADDIQSIMDAIDGEVSRARALVDRATR